MSRKVEEEKREWKEEKMKSRKTDLKRLIQGAKYKIWPWYRVKEKYISKGRLVKEITGPEKGRGKVAKYKRERFINEHIIKGFYEISSPQWKKDTLSKHRIKNKVRLEKGERKKILESMERRVDVIAFRAGWVRSLSQARLLCKKGIIRQIVMDWEVQPNTISKGVQGLEEKPNKIKRVWEEKLNKEKREKEKKKEKRVIEENPNKRVWEEKQEWERGQVEEEKGEKNKREKLIKIKWNNKVEPGMLLVMKLKVKKGLRKQMSRIANMQMIQKGMVNKKKKVKDFSSYSSVGFSKKNMLMQGKGKGKMIERWKRLIRRLWKNKTWLERRNKKWIENKVVNSKVANNGVWVVPWVKTWVKMEKGDKGVEMRHYCMIVQEPTWRKTKVPVIAKI